jgi:hypothetical protein
MSIQLDNTNAGTVTLKPGTSGSYTMTLPVANASGALTNNGSGVMSFAASSSGLVLLSTVTASVSATVDIETTFSSTYNTYLLVADSVVLATTTATCLARVKAPSSYASDASYAYHTASLSTASSAYAASAATSGTSILVASSADTQTSVSNINFSMYIRHPADGGTTRPVMDWTGSFMVNTIAQVGLVGTGSYGSFAAWTGVRFLASTGNITSGTFRLYGIANS